MIKYIKNKIIEIILGTINSRQVKFDIINYFNYWGNKESKSGLGSTFIATQNITTSLPKFIAENNIKSMLDLPCGDCVWMSQLLSRTNMECFYYTGADVSLRIIRKNKETFSHLPYMQFLQLDLCKDVLPKSDLLFTRDCLFHLSNSDILSALNNIKRSEFKFIAMSGHDTSDDFPNEDIKTGMFRKINLKKPPFSFDVKKAEILNDGSSLEPDKKIYIFARKDLF